MMHNKSTPTSNNSQAAFSTEGKSGHSNEDQATELDGESSQVNANELVVINTEFSATQRRWRLSNLFSRNAVYIFVTLVLTVILLVDKFGDSSYFPTTIENQASNNILEEQNNQSINELQDIAKLIVEDDSRNIELIDNFTHKWAQLNDSLKQNFMHSFWFERFSNLLEDKIALHLSVDETQNDATTIYNNAVLEMASLVGISVINEPQESTDSNQEHEQILQAISAEIAKVEMEKQKSLNSTPALESLLEQATYDGQADEQVAIQFVEAVQEKRSTQGFTEPDLTYLLGQYAATYEFGNTNRMMEFFNVNKEYKRRLKSSFKKVFSTSNKRRIVFSNLQWEFYENSIVGNGKYKAKLHLKNNKGKRFIDADIRIKMRVNKDELQIAKIDFENIDVKRIKSKSNFKKVANKTNSQITIATTQKRNSIQNHPATDIKSKPTSNIASTRITESTQEPTVAELQDVVTRFIQAYESGNIRALDQIFSENAKTNDKTDLKGIKQDYKDLFARTSDRQLFIKNLSWSINKNKAQGSGKLNVIIIPDGDNTLNSQKGDIEIAASKINNKVFITHLYHDIR